MRHLAQDFFAGFPINLSANQDGIAVFQRCQQIEIFCAQAVAVDWLKLASQREVDQLCLVGVVEMLGFLSLLIANHLQDFIGNLV